VITRQLTPHQHKLYSEILCRVRLGVCALEMLHVELEDDFHTLYRLTGNPLFKRASETLHSAPHPLVHQGFPQ
jgi:hypothetical protein